MVFFDIGATDADSATKRQELRQDLIATISPSVAERVLTDFAVPGGLRPLLEVDRKPSYKYVLLNPASPLWADPLKNRLYTTLEEASETPEGRDNCLVLLDLVLRGLKSNLDATDAESVKILLKDGRFVRGFWSAITRGRIQYRHQLDLLSSRKTLIDAGAAEEDLPIPDWLAERVLDR